MPQKVKGAAGLGTCHPGVKGVLFWREEGQFSGQLRGIRLPGAPEKAGIASNFFVHERVTGFEPGSGHSRYLWVGKGQGRVIVAPEDTAAACCDALRAPHLAPISLNTPKMDNGHESADF